MFYRQGRVRYSYCVQLLLLQEPRVKRLEAPRAKKSTCEKRKTRVSEGEVIGSKLEDFVPVHVCSHIPVSGSVACMLWLSHLFFAFD